MSKIRVGMVKTKNRKSVIHTGMLQALEQTTEKGKTMKIKVKILSHLPGVYTSCQPEVGKVYEASYKAINETRQNAPICVISVNGKQICLKPNEYEILWEIKNE